MKRENLAFISFLHQSALIKWQDGKKRQHEEYIVANDDSGISVCFRFQFHSSIPSDHELYHLPVNAIWWARALMSTQTSHVIPSVSPITGGRVSEWTCHHKGNHRLWQCFFCTTWGVIPVECISNMHICQSHLEDLFKHRSLDLPDSEDLGWCPGIGVSNNPGDDDDAGPWITAWEPLIEASHLLLEYRACMIDVAYSEILKEYCEILHFNK